MNRSKTYDLVMIGLFAVVIAICYWISIPTTVQFTMQTFAVFLNVALLGGKKGSITVFVYILLGAVGVPVFAGFRGGIGVLVGNTGGYIVGFLCSALLMWGMEKVMKKNTVSLAIQMVAGLILCYIFGTAWFMILYTKTIGSIGLLSVLGMCVFPFVIPDLLKIVLALFLQKRLAPHMYGMQKAAE